MKYEQFRYEMREAMAWQDKLLASVRRAWLLPGRAKSENYVARLGFRPRSLLPIVVVETHDTPVNLMDPGPGVDINRLPLSALDKYTSISRAVADWRRGDGVLPEGEDHLLDGPGHQAIPLPHP